MPRKPKEADCGTIHAATTSTSDGKKLRSYLDRIAEVQGEIDKIMDQAKLACEPHREDIKEIKKEANEAGFSAKEFNTLIRKERLDRKIENIAENLNEQQKERFDDMIAALEVLSEQMGDLGKAAFDIAKKGAEAGLH